MPRPGMPEGSAHTALALGPFTRWWFWGQRGCPSQIAKVQLMHWRPFAAGPELSEVAAANFLQHCPQWGDLALLEPISMEQFARLVEHAPNPSPGPDGIPYKAWVSCGQASATLLYNVCLDILGGRCPPPKFNASLMVFIPKGSGTDAQHEARAQDFRPIALSNTAHKIVDRALNCTRERTAQVAVHPQQRGFVSGRQMLQNVFEVTSAMHRSCFFPAPLSGITLLDIKAAFPSALWSWIWRVLKRMGAPCWVTTALQALYLNSSATVVFNGIVSTAHFHIGRGIKQGCPSSGSVWAILFDPIVRRLVANVRECDTRAMMSALAGDLAAAFFDSVVGLQALAPALQEMRLAAGLALSHSKCCVVNFSVNSNFRMQRALNENAGLPFAVVSQGPFLGVRIGPEAESSFWSKARLKYLAREAHLRALAGPARERLAA